MKMKHFIVYYSFTMEHFICISGVAWWLRADGHDEIKKELGSYQLLPLHDLFNSYPLSFSRSNVPNDVTTFTRNATTSHHAHACSKFVARCCYASISTLRLVVAIKRCCAQTSGLFCKLQFQLLLCGTELLLGDQPHHERAKS